MFVEAPICETRQPSNDAVTIGMENVGAIVMYHHTMRIRTVIRIAGDVRAAVDHLDAIAGVGCFSRHHATGKTGTDD